MRKLLFVCAVTLALLPFLPSADAAVTANSFVSPQTPNRGIVQFLQGTDAAGTYKTIYTPGSNGSRCNSLWLTTTDGTNPHLVTVQITNSAVNYGGTAITTVLSAGFTNGNPALNIMSPTIWPGLPIDQFGNPYLQLISGDTLRATFASNLASATVINLVASCADF